MKSKQSEVLELESELLRLNDMVRARRAQLERLEKCPNKDCECRRVWKEVVEQNVAGQFGKIRKRIRPAKSAAAKRNGSARPKGSR
jgi:hypothetical protein